MGNSPDHAILAALVYFDMFDFPLTLLELREYALCQNTPGSAWSLARIREALGAEGALGRVVRERNGYYFLRGRDAILATRAERYVVAQEKYRRALRATALLSRLPFVRQISVCNSLSYRNARQESDIDLFVIASKGGVWWARFFSLALLSLLRLRPGQRGVRNTICVSFFADEANLDMRTLQMGEHDVYFWYWLATLYPVYDAGGYAKRLFFENRAVLAPLSALRLAVPHPALFARHGAGIRRGVEFFLRPFSCIAERFQRWLFPKSILELLNRDTRVRVQAGVLKFHTNDRRAQYAAAFESRLASIVGQLT